MPSDKSKSYCIYLTGPQHSRLMDCLRKIRRDLENEGQYKSFCAIARDLLLEAAEQTVEEIRLLTTPLTPLSTPSIDHQAFRECVVQDLLALGDTHR